MTIIVCLIILAAIIGFIYWRLARTNMDVPANAEEPDSQIVNYIQPFRGNNI